MVDTRSYPGIHADELIQGGNPDMPGKTTLLLKGWVLNQVILTPLPGRREGLKIEFTLLTKDLINHMYLMKPE